MVPAHSVVQELVGNPASLNTEVASLTHCLWAGWSGHPKEPRTDATRVAARALDWRSAGEDRRRCERTGGPLGWRRADAARTFFARPESQTFMTKGAQLLLFNYHSLAYCCVDCLSLAIHCWCVAFSLLASQARTPECSRGHGAQKRFIFSLRFLAFSPCKVRVFLRQRCRR